MNETELNTAIYNKLADVAREVFNHIICAPGTYAVADIARAIHSVEGHREERRTDADGVTRTHRVPTVSRCWRSGFFWAEGYDPQADTHTVTVENFTATVNGWGVWLVLAQAATAWSIPTAARPVFARKAETTGETTAAEVATFAVTRELRDLAAIPDPAEKLRPVYTYIFIDCRRRAAVACNGYLLRVVELPDLTTTTAAAGYLIAPALLKSGRGRVTITADGYAQNGDTLAPVGEGRFPDWAQLVQNSLAEGYSEAARVELTPATFREIKKTVKDFGKFAKEYKADTPRVTIAATVAADRLTIYAARPDFGQTRETAAALPTAARASFNVVLRADQFAKLADVSALYIVSNTAAIFATAPRGFYYFMPLLAEDGAKFYEPFRVAPAGETFDPLANFAETPQADTIESVETIAAATVSETPAEAITPAPAAVTIETPAPVSVETPAEAENVAENVETPAAPAADPLTPAEAVSVAENERETPQADTLTPADRERIAAEVAEAIERENATAEAVACRPAWFVEGRPVTFYDIDTDTDRVAFLTCCRYVGGDWLADLTAPDSLTIVGANAREVAPAPAEPVELAPATLKNMKTAAQVELLTPKATENDIYRAQRELRAEGLTLRGHRFELLATGETVARVRVTRYNKNGDALRVRVVFPTYPTPQAETPAETITPAPAADDSQDTPAEVISESEADALPVTFYDPAAGVIVWALADELPTADGLTADTVTPADLLAPVFVAVSVAEVADPADTPQADREADTDRENAPQADETPRALLLTIAHRARRWAVAVAAAVAALLLLTLTPDRPAVSVAAPAADLLAPVADTLTAADRETITDETPADLLADTLTRETAAAPVFEAVSVAETAAPAADRPAPRKRAHRPRKRPALLLAPDTLTREAVAADTLAPVALLTIETPDTLTADTIEADTLAPVADVIRAEVADTLTADTLTRETIETPDTIAAPQVAPDTIETADTLTAAPQVAPDTIDETADPVADELAPVAPAADLLTPAEVADTIDTPQADPLAVVATAGTPSPYVIACEIIHPSQAAPAAGLVIGSAPNHWPALTL